MKSQSELEHHFTTFVFRFQQLNSSEQHDLKPEDLMKTVVFLRPHVVVIALTENDEIYGDRKGFHIKYFGPRMIG